MRRQGGEVVLPRVLDDLFLGIVGGGVGEGDGDGVPGEGLAELEIEGGLLRVEAGGKEAIADDELMGADSGVVRIEEAGAVALDLEGVEEILGEGVKALVLIGGEDELIGGGGAAELVEHVLGGGAVELLGGSMEREKKSQEDDRTTRRVPTHERFPFCSFARVLARGG